ncbi:hypothetical protein GCM10009775_01200 [Microbacterium aoyamense]|uniref:DUF4012 domain-containing protein n=1 Tax=Microbacterium aoyamense TaxID=344166 RepID=A0ABN2P5D8_9MICO
MLWVVLTLTAIVAVLVACGAWVGIRALMAKSELEMIMPLAAPIQEAADARDLDSLRELLAEAEGHAAEARGLTGDPVWRAAEWVPVIGPNLAGARVVSASADALAAGVGEVLDEIQQIGADGDDLGLESAAELAPSLSAAAEAFTTAGAELSALEPAAMIPQVADGVGALEAVVSQGAPYITTVADIAAVLPTLLGVGGRSEVLLVIQNGAEVRTAGGIAGWFILLDANEGTLTVVDQADAADFPPRDPEVSGFPASTAELYGAGAGAFIQNSTMTPDFAVTAGLISSWWTEVKGQEPDAVLSIDLPAVAALVGATGPLLLPDGTEIAGESLVEALVVDTYFDFDREEQSTVQRAVVAAAAAQLFRGASDPIAWSQALLAPVQDGRISAWSADTSLQDEISHSVLGGQSVRLAGADPQAFGVYLNDDTAGKMGPYLRVGMAAGAIECRSDGRQDLIVTVVLSNDAPADAATWPWWITGGGIEGVPPGEISTSVSVASSDDVVLNGVRVDGEIVQTVTATEAGSPTTAASVTAAPGTSHTIEFRYTQRTAGDTDISLIHTPLLDDVELLDLAPACP